MKAILIDPERKSITEVEHDDSLEDIHLLVDCSTIDAVRIDGRDVIYVDDDGLYVKKHFFTFGHSLSPIAGKGLVLGTDHDGYSIAPEKATVESLERDIHWISREDAINLARRDDKIRHLLAKGNSGHIVVSAADIIEDAEYSGEPEQGE